MEKIDMAVYITKKAFLCPHLIDKDHWHVKLLMKYSKAALEVAYKKARDLEIRDANFNSYIEKLHTKRIL